jgi:hypothetical protein
LQRLAGNRAALGALRSPTARAGPFVVRRNGDPSAATDDYVKFDSIYDSYCGTYTFVAQQQVNAIDAMYTEAKKPPKPGLLEELLISFATAGLGSVVSMLGTMVDRSVEKKLLERLNIADPKSTENAALKAGIQAARDNVKLVAKGANDGFKDGVKQFVGPKVRELLSSGKKPIDAFYEGQKSSVVDAAKQAFQEAKKNEPLVWALRDLLPGLALAAAQSLLDSVNEAFAHAEELQKRETLRHWLIYQAQEQLSADDKPSPQGTDLSPLVREGTDRNLPAILFVEAYVADAGDGKYTAFADGGRLAGLSKPMLASLSGAIRQLNLPMVFSVSSRKELGGLGEPGSSPGNAVAENAFFVGVNEENHAWVNAREKWQKEALQKIGGVDKLLDQLGMYTLENLKVKADKS